ncbi:MAG: hypothetical protein HPY50_18140 [Firmicutes bacterium]|nr:hypothetical protein [Bacillota bacterium]
MPCEEVDIVGAMSTLPGKIERNDPCPCGSGKKYKKCCMGKEQPAPAAASVAYTNYRGEEARFDPTAADRDAEKLKTLLDNLHYKREVGLKKGIQSLQEIYDHFSALQSHFTSRASCQKGCSYCCGLHITTSRLEAEFARLYMQSVFDPAARESILGRIRNNREHYLSQEELESLQHDPAAVDQKLDAYLAKQITCPFLSGEGACTIYPVRPFNCRSLVVVSHPDDCRAHRGTHLKLYNINDYVLASIANLSRKVFGENEGERHFPAWFVGGFES